MVHYQSRAQVPAPCVGKPRRPPVLQVSVVQYARRGVGGGTPASSATCSLASASLTPGLQAEAGRRREKHKVVAAARRAPWMTSFCLSRISGEGAHRLESQEVSAVSKETLLTLIRSRLSAWTKLELLLVFLSVLR